MLYVSSYADLQSHNPKTRYTNLLLLTDSPSNFTSDCTPLRQTHPLTSLQTAPHSDRLTLSLHFRLHPTQTDSHSNFTSDCNPLRQTHPLTSLQTAIHSDRLTL